MTLKKTEPSKSRGDMGGGGIGLRIYVGYCSYLHTAWNESHFPAAKAYLCLDSSHMQFYFPNHWTMQIFFHLYDDKVLILKCSLF